MKPKSCVPGLVTFKFNLCTVKEKSKFHSNTYMEIQMGAVAKSYMRKGFLIYMRKYADI
jgi:hypothetical protein